MRVSFPRIDWALVQRLTGRATPDDRHVVGEWMAEYESGRAGPAELDGAIDELDVGLRSRDAAWERAAWAAVSQRAGIGAPNGETAPSVMSRRSTPRRPVRPWLAVGVAGAIVCGAMAMRYWSSARVTTSRPLAYSTGMGQRATIALPDGSQVMLDVASRLDVPSDFAAGNHVLRLNGHAAFAVTHHDNAPISVIAGGITTQVLGTEFAVRHYDSDRSTTVTVRDGRVSVRSTLQPIVLAASQQVRFDSSGAKIGAMDPDAFAFEHGVLSLTHVSLRDAIPELNRWYDADIRLADPALGDAPLTSRLGAGSVIDLIDMLELTFGVRVERDGRVLTVFRR